MGAGGDVGAEASGDADVVDADIVLEQTDEKPKPWIFAEVLESKRAEDVKSALQRIVNEINFTFRLPAVWSVHSDLGGEFVGEVVRAYCRQAGLHCSTGPGYDPDSNSRAERAIGVIKDMSRRMLHDARLSSPWWVALQPMPV